MLRSGGISQTLYLAQNETWQETDALAVIQTLDWEGQTMAQVRLKERRNEIR